MSWKGALRGLLKALALFLVLLVLSLGMCTCPPWSLKYAIAHRAGCQGNLHSIRQEVRARAIPFDREHVADIEAVIREMGLTCTEGSQVKGRPAGYHVEVRADGIVITEEPGNHPAHKRFMAGQVREERFEVDADGIVRQHTGP